MSFPLSSQKQQDLIAFSDWISSHLCNKCGLREGAWARNCHNFPFPPYQLHKNRITDEVSGWQWIPIHKTYKATPKDQVSVLVLGSDPYLEMTLYSKSNHLIDPVIDSQHPVSTLTALLQAAGVTQLNPVYTSQVLCVPFKSAEKSDIAACYDHLGMLLYYLQPSVIIAAGASVARSLLDLPTRYTMKDILEMPQEERVLDTNVILYKRQMPDTSIMVMPGAHKIENYRIEVPVLCALSPRSLLHPGNLEERVTALQKSWYDIYIQLEDLYMA